MKEYRRTIIIGILFLVFVGFIYTTGLRLFVEFTTSQIPLKWDAAVGEMTIEDIYESPPPQAGQPMRAILEKSTQPFQSLDTLRHLKFTVFIVENDSIQNAFALPGGYLLIYRGILNIMEDQQEWFGLLAHELGHIYHRHGMKRMVRQSFFSIIVALILGGDEGLTETIVSGGAQLVSFSYDRSEERAADRFAMETLQQLNIDNSGLKRLFTKLKELEEGKVPPALLSTHPSTDDRIDYLTDMIDSSNINTQQILTDKEWNYLKTLKN